MKNISLIARKATSPSRGPMPTRQLTGSHCPISGIWQDQFGGLRFVAKGAIFPATTNGPSGWSLHEAEFESTLP